MNEKKNILFLTGTRADYGKIKSLMTKVKEHPNLDLSIFVTGMHMLKKYGSTWRELEKDGFTDTFHFINQHEKSSMDMTLSETIKGLSHYIKESKPDLIVIHGDRLEALAGAIVGAFNNIKVAHIEGGEVSGTIDESIRHAITKFSHFHFVSNEEAKKRIIQLGENAENTYVIGSPDIDIMLDENLPSINKTKEKYEITYDSYTIVMYHPVTTSVDALKGNVEQLVNVIEQSDDNFIVIYPNNDEGNELIIEEYKRLNNLNNVKVYPSISFEHFLTLLKYSNMIVGNSSAGIREAGVYGISSVDIGTRQNNRYDPINSQHIIHTDHDENSINEAIKRAKNIKLSPLSLFGEGNSDEKFIETIEKESFWNSNIQKSFVDVHY